MPYNPFTRWPITGTWEDHMSYSLGGTDYPTPYGTPIPAPASGTLRTSGGSGEFKAGLVGSAGRRSILMLDAPIRDVVAVVFQHQAAFGAERHYAEGETCGKTGASTVRDNGTVNDFGGDIHVHVHCLTASGARRRFEDYFTSSTPAPAGSGTTITNPYAESDEDMAEILVRQNPDRSLPAHPAHYFLTGDYVAHIVHDDVVRVEQAFGVKGGFNINQINPDDLRRRIEVRGLDWAKVNGLKPGQGVGRDGVIRDAGIKVW